MKKIKMMLPILAVLLATAGVFASKASFSSENAWYSIDGVLTKCDKAGKCNEFGYVQCMASGEDDDIPAGTLLYKRNGSVCNTILLGEFEE